MNTKEMREKNVKDLENELLELNKEQFKLRMQKGTNQLKKTHLLRNVGRCIARVKTIIHEKKGAVNE